MEVDINKKLFFVLFVFIFGLGVFVRGCSSSVGVASWYSSSFEGKKTASGEIYDSGKLTAAHRKLAFGTRVRVTDLSNDKHVVVKINDRGPFVRGRIIDLSLAAARKLDMLKKGLTKVRIKVVSKE